jgi:hypothetical protein
MDLVSATKKISQCIDSAISVEHHKSINRMIQNVENWCEYHYRSDKTVKGAIALLGWQNVYKHDKNFGVSNNLLSLYQQNKNKIK